MLIPAKRVNSFFQYLQKIRLFVAYLGELGECHAKLRFLGLFWQENCVGIYQGCGA